MESNIRHLARMHDPEFEPADEQRRYQRMRSFKTAIVQFKPVGKPVSVRIVDMSSAGAQMELAEDQPATDVFDLVIHPDDPASRMRVRCQLRWQRNGHIGVSFI